MGRGANDTAASSEENNASTMQERHQAYAARLSSDFKLKSCPAFVGCTGTQAKGPKVLCFNNQDIPLKPEGFGEKKQLIVEFVVVDCKMAGFTRVPYFCTGGDKYKLGDNPLPLSEKGTWSGDPSGKLSELTCYPFEIVPGRPKNKNKRNESCMWKVCPGMVLRNTFWSDVSRGSESMKKMRVELTAAGYDCIPAFSLLEVEMVCKGWSQWKEGDKDPLNPEMDVELSPVAKGYGMGVNAIRVLEGVSLHSVADVLPVILPPTLDECKTRQQEWQNKFHAIRDVIQTERVPFFVKAASIFTSIDIDDSPGMADEPKQIRLTNWCPNSASGRPCSEAGYAIDILYEHALHATNSDNIKSACSLLELAANAGALSLVVFFNQYRPGKMHVKSMLYGYPIIDTAVLLKCIQVPIDPESLMVDDTENYFAFRADFQVAFPSGPLSSAPDGAGDDEHGEDEEGEELMNPLILISKEPFTNIKGEHKRPKCPDFMLVSPNVQLARAYYARIVHPVLQHQCILWSGYINMTKPQITSSGLAYNILHAAALASASASCLAAGSGGGSCGGSAASLAASSALAGKKKRSRLAEAQAQADAFDPFKSSSRKKGKVLKPSKAAPLPASQSQGGRADNEDGDDDDDDDGNGSNVIDEPFADEDEVNINTHCDAKGSRSPSPAILTQAPRKKSKSEEKSSGKSKGRSGGGGGSSKQG